MKKLLNFGFSLSTNSRLLLNVLSLIIVGCVKPAPYPPPGFSLQLYYKTQSGADLLNPSVTGHFNKDSIMVLSRTIENGVQIEAPARMDSCTTYLCGPDNKGLYYIQFLPSVNYINSQKYNGSIIHLNSKTIDTLMYEPIAMNSGFGINKVLYKNNVVWTWNPNPSANSNKRINIALKR